MKTVVQVIGGEMLHATAYKLTVYGLSMAAMHPSWSPSILWCGLNEYISSDKIPAGCRVIATPTTGLTHIDLDAAKARGITVLSLQGSDLTDVWATAEHTIGLILALLRKIPAAVEHVREGGWDRDKFRGTELRGKKAAVIGCGRVGNQVMQLLQAFGVQCAGSWSDEGTARIVGDADIVCLHENYEPSKRGKYGQAFFESLKVGAVFVNTARGELVDETVLWNALRAGHVGGAALDVLADEHQRAIVTHYDLSPEQRQRMRADWEKIQRDSTHCGTIVLDTGMQVREVKNIPPDIGNVIVTPHLGGCTYESQAKTELILADKLIEWWKENA